VSRRSIAALVAALVAAGIALRAAILRSELGALDGDEAVWGTMARHVLDGEITTFFWGQSHGGTQEVLLTAVVFAATGASVEALRVVPLMLFAVAALLTWRVGIRTVGEPYARLGAAAFWAWSIYVVWKSTRAHGFYGAGLVLGLAVVLLALRLAERPRRRDGILLGLALGLGGWATPQVLMLAVPALGWLAFRRRDLLHDAWIPAFAALVASVPWLVANLRHDWYSFTSAPPAGETPLDRLHNLGATTLPSALGLRLPFTLEWVGGATVGTALYALACTAIAWTLVRRRRELGPLVPVVVLFPLFYAASSYAGMIAEPRYLVLLGPVLALVLVTAGGTPRRSGAIACGLAALTAVGIGVLDRDQAAVVEVEGVAMPSDMTQLLRELQRHRVRHAYADYWVSWRIVFETDERTIAVPRGPARRGSPPEEGRYPPFYRRVAASADVAYVFLRDGDRRLVEEPRLLASGYLLVEAAEFAVLLPPRRP
jgi:hypothetical protein